MIVESTGNVKGSASRDNGCVIKGKAISLKPKVAIRVMNSVFGMYLNQ